MLLSTSISKAAQLQIPELKHRSMYNGRNTVGHQIIIENSTIEDSKITNRVYLSAEDGSIVIRDMKLTKTKLVNDLDIPQFCSSIQNQRMDAAERTSMQSVLKKRGNKKTLWML